MAERSGGWVGIAGITRTETDDDDGETDTDRQTDRPANRETGRGTAAELQSRVNR